MSNQKIETNRKRIFQVFKSGYAESNQEEVLMPTAYNSNEHENPKSNSEEVLYPIGVVPEEDQ